MINSFVGQYRWLSNFSISHVLYDTKFYPTVENAYQAAKTTGSRIPFETCSPGVAKRLGRRIKIRCNWDNMKIDIMRSLLVQKFKKGNMFADYLINTGCEKIVEGNTWGDIFWGVCNGVGSNNLGKLLMDIRRDLIK